MTQPPKGKWIDGLEADTPIGVAAAMAIGVRFDAVCHYLPLAAQRAGDDVEYVHQLRVTTRRASASLSMFEAVLTKKSPLKKAKKALRKIRQSAALARQCDVQTTDLATRHHNAPAYQQQVLEEVIRLLATRRQESQADILKSEGKYIQRKLAKRRKRVLASIDKSSKLSRKPFTVLASRKLPGLIEAFERRAQNLTQFDDLHWLRIEGKRLRYALEVFAPCFGDTFKNLYPRFKTLQDALGEVNDLHELAALFREYGVLTTDEDKVARAVMNQGFPDDIRERALGELIAELEDTRDDLAAKFLERWHNGEWTEVLRSLDEWAHPLRGTEKTESPPEINIVQHPSAVNEA